MKQSQWVLAAVLLAGMVFVVTFAMNYLGGGGQTAADPTTLLPSPELVFAVKNFPPDVRTLHECEEQTAGHADYWFVNPNAETVQVGLQGKNCPCAGVELFVLPEARRGWLVSEAVALAGMGFGGALVPPTVHAAAQRQLQQDLEGVQLLNKNEKTPVGPGEIGWVRLHWSGRKKGRTTLDASLWFDNPQSGKTGTLSVALYFHEPLRVNPSLRIRPLRDEDLERGVTENIICWSSTRTSLDLRVTTQHLRDRPESDPFVLGTPRRLSPAEVQALVRKHNPPPPKESDEAVRGQVMCAYRVPVTLRAVSADGTTPFDVGAFQRGVNLSLSTAGGPAEIEPKSVVVYGRVRGVVEVGGDEDGGEVNFRAFPRQRGKTASVYLEGQRPDLKLEVDTARTSSFLTAGLEPDKERSTGQGWRLTIRVRPGQAEGPFPRANNPVYEDAAVYLKALVPGKPPRSIRIPVQGIAEGG